MLEKYFAACIKFRIWSFDAPKVIVIYILERKICLHGMDEMLLVGSKYVRSIQLISIWSSLDERWSFK